MTKLQSLDPHKKQMLFVELVGLALADTQYAKPEKVLLKQAGHILSLSTEKRQRLVALVDNILSIYRELNEEIKK
jgi:hypothetical protein